MLQLTLTAYLGTVLLSAWPTTTMAANQWHQRRQQLTNIASNRALDLDLPSTLVFDYPSGEAMVDYIMTCLPPPPAPVAAPVVAQPHLIPEAAATGTPDGDSAWCAAGGLVHVPMKSVHQSAHSLWTWLQVQILLTAMAMHTSLLQPA